MDVAHWSVGVPVCPLWRVFVGADIPGGVLREELGLVRIKMEQLLPER